MDPITLDQESEILLRQLREYVRMRRWHPEKTPGRLRLLADVFAKERAEELQRRAILKDEAVREAEAILRQKPEEGTAQ